jgi:hypothetical protein
MEKRGVRVTVLAVVFCVVTLVLCGSFVWHACWLRWVIVPELRREVERIKGETQTHAEIACKARDDVKASLPGLQEVNVEILDAFKAQALKIKDLEAQLVAQRMRGR